MEDTMKGKNCNPETFFLEIRNVKNTVREIETHIDIADYKELGPKWEDFYEGHKLLNTSEEKEELYKMWLKWYRSK